MRFIEELKKYCCMKCNKLLDSSETNSHRCLNPSFKVKPSYSVEGDMISVYFEDEPCHAKVINEFVTVERSDRGNRIVGVKLYKIKELLKIMESHDSHRSKEDYS